jgi:acyl-CoA thioester hydrolase
MDTEFTLELSVRDYECDLQGVVNNAVYQNYLEHTRHRYLLSQGLDFAEITEAGVHLVVLRAELDYLLPLVSGDEFTVTLQGGRISRLKVLFHQEIVRNSDQKLMLRAKIFGGVVAKSGRANLPAELEAFLDKLPKVSRK